MRKLLATLFVAALTNSSFAYYQAQQGRWISRDPIGEQGGVNIYAQSKNAPINRVDPLGLADLWMNFGFDDSTTFNANKDAINSQKSDLQNAMDQCCKEFSIGCGTKVKADYDFNRKNKPAPSDGTYNLGEYGKTPDGELLLSNLGNISTPHSGSGLNYLITGSSIEQIWEGQTIGTQGSTMPTGGSGINTSYLGTPNLLSHEGGHQVGYNGGPDGAIHSSDPNNIMSTANQSGQTFDKCACQKMSDAAE